MNPSASTPRDLELKSELIPTSLPFSYRHKPTAAAKLLVIFLHGYTDHAGSFLGRLFPERWPDVFSQVAVLAPNGPFPVPVKSESGWREAYAWYFFDERTQTMVVSPETAILGCEKLIADNGYTETPKLIIGFSQGGFLAPRLANRLKHVVEIIGVATGFNEADYRAGAPWTVTTIHGESDEVFPIARARDAHDKILARGLRGAFHKIVKLGHVASPEVGDKIVERVKTYL